MDTLQKLRRRLAELSDLAALNGLATWDQAVMMPSRGGEARAHQLGTLARLAHERATSEDIGEWLAELQQADLGEIDRDILRLARRDWERAKLIPADLAAERSRADAEGQERWELAREQDDFAGFIPALARNVELARAYGQCLAQDGGGPYQALLGDYDFGLRTDDLRRLFADLSERLPPLVAEASRRTPRRDLAVPVAAQQAAVTAVLRRIGVEPDGWRLDLSTHPFTAEMGRGDLRITTRYDDGNLESLLSSLHEYGHALYEHQIDPALDRTNLATGTSMSIHESQSKLWENHVGRSPAFAEVLAAELGTGGFQIAPSDLHAILVGVQPSLIRVSADMITYPLHIALRFELELALIEGDLSVPDLPAAWNDGMRRLLGLDVPSDALGCLQDIHWGAGSFGYFPSYALGCLIAAQLWEAIRADQDDLDEELRHGQVSRVKDWLAEHVHRYGRRLDTIPLLERATGRGLEIDPFLRAVAPLALGVG